MQRIALRRAIVAGLLSAICNASGAGAAPQAEIPQFAPNASVGWVAFAPAFIAPRSGPGPVRDDPADPRIGCDEIRALCAQPTFPLPDLNSPLLQPWVREELRKRSEKIL